MSESWRRNLFLALCALVLLHTGVHLSQSFINYPGWYVLEAESFKAYHYPMSIRAGILGGAPRLFELVLALVLLRFPSRAVPRWIRNVLEWGRTALYVWALSRLIAPAPSGRPAT